MRSPSQPGARGRSVGGGARKARHAGRAAIQSQAKRVRGVCLAFVEQRFPAAGGRVEELYGQTQKKKEGRFQEAPGTAQPPQAAITSSAGPTDPADHHLRRKRSRQPDALATARPCALSGIRAEWFMGLPASAFQVADDRLSAICRGTLGLGRPDGCRGRECQRPRRSSSACTRFWLSSCWFCSRGAYGDMPGSSWLRRKPSTPGIWTGAKFTAATSLGWTRRTMTNAPARWLRQDCAGPVTTSLSLCRGYRPSPGPSCGSSLTTTARRWPLCST